MIDTLSRPNKLFVPPSKREIYANVSLSVSSSDGMHLGKNDHHYLSVGLSAITIIQANQDLAQIRGFDSILDFGAGAGRVTRWMRAAYPSATITVAELRQQDLEFCAAEFGASVWPTGTDLGQLKAPETYDLIWMGSVITHLSADRTQALLESALTWCKPKGLLIVSFHGRSAFQFRNERPYLDRAKIAEVEGQFWSAGYAYCDYPNQVNYGISFIDPSWLLEKVKGFDCRLLSVSERVWDNHHDVLALQRA